METTLIERLFLLASSSVRKMLLTWQVITTAIIDGLFLGDPGVSGSSCAEEALATISTTNNYMNSFVRKEVLLDGFVVVGFL